MGSARYRSLATGVLAASTVRRLALSLLKSCVYGLLPVYSQTMKRAARWDLPGPDPLQRCRFSDRCKSPVEQMKGSIQGVQAMVGVQ